jgi:hypothetical protein
MFKKFKAENTWLTAALVWWVGQWMHVQIGVKPNLRDCLVQAKKSQFC